MAATASWKLIAIVVGVGLLSTAIPYTFEALAMRRLAASTFALFAAILPATSALVGAVMLRQIPGVFELIGLVLVSSRSGWPRASKAEWWAFCGAGSAIPTDSRGWAMKDGAFR